MLDTIEKFQTEFRQTARCNALSAKFRRDVDSFQIDYIRSFRRDVCFEDELAVFKNNECAPLFDSVQTAFEKTFAVFEHRVNTAFDERDFGVRFGDLFNLVSFGAANFPTAFLFQKRKVKFKQQFGAGQTRLLSGDRVILPESFNRPY